MLRSAASKVMWVGRATVFLVGLAVILALLFGVATTALAGTGVGATFNLGQKNTVDRLSQLVGSTAGSMLLVDNNGTGTALDLRVGQGTDPTTKTVAPMKVDSQVRVTNLNADELDGVDSTEFSLAGHDHDLRYYTETESDGLFVNETDHTKAAHDALDIDADTVDGKHAADFYAQGAKVADSDNLDGKDAGAFLESNGKAQDSDKLDGVDSSAFAGTGTTSYRSFTPLSACSQQVLLSRTISPSRPALVYAIGTGVYNPNASNLEVVRLSLELREVSSLTGSTVVAGGGLTDADGNGGDVPLTIQGVLMSGSGADAVYSSSTPFEVTPGKSYVLRLIGEPTSGNCTGTPVMRSTALTYVLIGK